MVDGRGGQAAGVAVSIVVPCRNEASHLADFIRDVEAQRDVDGGIEIIVADGDSNDGSREILSNWAKGNPRVRIIRNENRTVSAGLNAAIRVAQGDVIVRMDVHSVYAPDYVSESLKVLRITGADNVGGAARARMGASLVQRANAAAYASPFAVGGARFHEPDHEGSVDTVPYGCWRKATLVDLGLFDEALVRNQDDELNLRIRLAGGTVWQSPRIRSWYWPRSTLGGVLRQYFQYGYWKVRVIGKHRRAASWRHLVPGAVVATGLLLGLAGVLLPASWMVLAVLAFAYVLVSVVYALRAAWRARDWRIAPVLPLIFAIYHGGYGAGFLLGAVDYLGGRKAGRRSVEALTR